MPSQKPQKNYTKPVVAMIGFTLLGLPLLRYISFDDRIADASSTVGMVSALRSVYSGLMVGFFGLMILGFLVDGGAGYRKPGLLFVMAIVGVAWTIFYPSGWMLGLPSILYPAGRGFGLVGQVRKGQKNKPKREESIGATSRSNTCD